MDVERVRADFPLLQRQFQGRPFAYLDSAATSQKPQIVLDAINEYYRAHNANVHRGVYALSEEATNAYEDARETATRFVGARDPNETVFVRGTTEALNLIASGLGQKLQRGDRVVVTRLEHHSNLVPWMMLRDRLGIELRNVNVDDEGRLDEAEFDQYLAERPKVVALGHVSNVLGTVLPIERLARAAHDAGATVVLDAAQSAPHRPLAVDRLGVDALAFSGHKMLGPTGIGILWGRSEFLRELPPYQGGGEMIREVHVDRVTFQDPPARFEAGTPNISGAIGLAAAMRYLTSIGFEDIMGHESNLTRYALDGFRDRFGERTRVFGPPAGPDRDAIFSFDLRGIHPHDVAQVLDARGIAVRSGHHCAQPLMERFHVPALSRASAYLYTKVEELDALFDGLENVEAVFARPTEAAPSAAPS